MLLVTITNLMSYDLSYTMLKGETGSLNQDQKVTEDARLIDEHLDEKIL
jgi:hypothetical protein